MGKSNHEEHIADELENLLPFAKGLSKQLLEADTAIKSNKIATQTLKKLKWDDFMHIVFLIIGGFISFLFTNILGADTHKETITEIHNLQTEIHVLKADYQKRLNEQHLIILELENQLTNIKRQLERE